MKKRKGKGVLPGKLYVNTIKQVLSKFNIPAEYKLQDREECIEITVSTLKISKKRHSKECLFYVSRETFIQNLL